MHLLRNLQRAVSAVEPELFPGLRHYGIAFDNYNPLIGGYSTGGHRRENTADDVDKGSRFDSKMRQGRDYRARYMNDAFCYALDIFDLL